MVDESGAGEGAAYSDAEYAKAGAEILSTAREVFDGSGHHCEGERAAAC